MIILGKNLQNEWEKPYMSLKGKYREQGNGSEVYLACLSNRMQAKGIGRKSVKRKTVGRKVREEKRGMWWAYIMTLCFIFYMDDTL